MERVTSLREQAELLRGLARSSDVPAIRDELLAMAADCERVAQPVAEHFECRAVGSAAPGSAWLTVILLDALRQLLALPRQIIESFLGFGRPESGGNVPQ